jgi:hypothetical protein
MSMLRLITAFVLALVVTSSATAAQDPQGLAILTQTFKALGGTLPVDSQASGTFDRVTGGIEDSGTIQILTRGYTQTAETITSGGNTTEIVYSQGYAAQKDEKGSALFSLEYSLSADSAVFPLITVAAAIQDPNSTIQFVGKETLNGVDAYHLTVSRGLADQNFKDLLAFSQKDIWVATDTGLPLEISYQMRDGEASAPSIAAALFFSDYRSVNEVMYPFLISKNVNGPPYMTIKISSVSFGVGLSDQDFALK